MNFEAVQGEAQASLADSSPAGVGARCTLHPFPFLNAISECWQIFNLHRRNTHTSLFDSRLTGMGAQVHNNENRSLSIPHSEA